MFLRGNTLGDLLPTNAQDKWRESTGAHGRSSELWQLAAEMLGVVPRPGACLAALSLLRAAGCLH